VNLVNENVQTITFEQVQDFCQLGVIENLQLDYKMNKPQDISKHIAGFSNAIGGLIIIGVGEDAHSAPRTWNGINNEDKLTDWVHQMASQVVPLPTYDVAVTDEVAGKVFLLIRIYEGQYAPYVTLSDPTVWVRTGNIRTELKSANREDLLRLVNKGINAETARDQVEDKMYEHLNDLVDRYKRDLSRRRAANEQSVPPTKSLSNTSLMSVRLMPYSPSKKLFRLKDYYGDVRTSEFISSNGHGYYSLALSAVPIPEGLASIRYSYRGDHASLQLYDNGAIQSTNDIRESGRDNPTTGGIYVSHILKELVNTLLAANKIYTTTSYNGVIRGTIHLKDVEELYVHRITAGGTDFDSNEVTSLSDRYEWSLELNTATLTSELELNNFLVETIERVHWDMGVDNPGDEVVKAFIAAHTPLTQFRFISPPIEADVEPEA